MSKNMNHKITEKEKTVRDDRVAYIYLKLKDCKPSIFIENLIKKLRITSESTARRVFNKIDKWSKFEKELFLAIYPPLKSDIEAVDEALGVKADKVSNEFKEEPTSEIEEADKLQKEIEELNEAIKESKIAIMEVCKEKDDKDEEIRVLNLELQKYKNDLNSVLDDRQKLECLLSDNANEVELNPKYDSLYKVLLAAYNQASNGKGKERHQLNDDEPFENQKICEIARRLSADYNLGQAVKKIYESKRLADGRDIAELYGAINYIAAAIIVKQENKNNDN